MEVAQMSYLFFFFSSRRRHTRLQGDWSSDVCSSDLNLQYVAENFHTVAETLHTVPARVATMQRVVTQDMRALWEGAEANFHEVSALDRKSTRLNSSHLVISYAVFCLKKNNP